MADDYMHFVTGDQLDLIDRYANRVKDFVVYKLKGDVLSCFMDLGDETQRIDFMYDEDFVLRFSSCTCKQEKCIHQALALASLRQCASEYKEMPYDDVASFDLGNALYMQRKKSLISMITSFYEKGRLTLDEIRLESARLTFEREKEDDDLEELSEILSAFTDPETFETVDLDEAMANFLDMSVPIFIENMKDAMDRNKKDEIKLFSQHFKKAFQVFADYGDDVAEPIQLAILNSAMTLFHLSRKLILPLRTLFTAHINSRPYFKDVKKALIEYEMGRLTEDLDTLNALSEILDNLD